MRKSPLLLLSWYGTACGLGFSRPPGRRGREENERRQGRQLRQPREVVLVRKLFTTVEI